MNSTTASASPSGALWLPSKPLLLVIALLLATIVVLLRRAGPTARCRSACHVIGALGGDADGRACGHDHHLGRVLRGTDLVVGLAVLGVSVATAFALQPFGGWLTVLGLGLLA